MSDLVDALDALDVALSVAARTLPDEQLERPASVASSARMRRGYLGSSIVVALAGGTGTGKSSLLNAVARAEVVEVGVRRPTTESAIAWHPSPAEPGLLKHLDAMGVSKRLEHHREFPAVLVDLPDTDSVVTEHRRLVDELLPRADAVLWIADPEKYADLELHRHLLAPAVPYATQFIFVLNQIDRLTKEDVPLVLADFRRLLVADGFDDPEVLGLAAAPPAGDPMHIEELERVLIDRVAVKQTVISRLMTDIRLAASELGRLAGVDRGPVGFDEVWLPARAEAETAIARMLMGSDVGDWTWREALLGRDSSASVDAGSWRRRPGLEQVLVPLTNVAHELERRSGAAFGRRIREHFNLEQIRSLVEEAVQVASEETGPPTVQPRRWWRWARFGFWVLITTALGMGLAASAVAQPPIALAVAVGAAIASVGLMAMLARSLGQSADRGRVEAGRVAAEAARAAVDSTVGAKYRLVLQDRAELAARIMEVSLKTTELDRGT